MNNDEYNVHDYRSSDENLVINDSSVYAEYIFAVSYNVTGSKHSGYCSDSGGVTTYEYAETAYFPILKSQFPNIVLYEDMTEELCYIYSYEIENCHCGHEDKYEVQSICPIKR
jgi:hypothetical protein